MEGIGNFYVFIAYRHGNVEWKKLVKNKVAWGQIIKEHIIHAKKYKYFSLSKKFWKDGVMNRFVFWEDVLIKPVQRLCSR